MANPSLLILGEDPQLWYPWPMSKRYPIPAGESDIELRVKNSRFIGRAAYTPSIDDAKAFHARLRYELDKSRRLRLSKDALERTFVYPSEAEGPK